MIRLDRKKTGYDKGFTLVELLVAVAVLIILMGVMFSVINPRGIQQKARDSQRQADLAKIKVALESYFADNRAYPLSTAQNWSLITATMPAGIEGSYINKIPSDPKPVVPASTPQVCNGSERWFNYSYKSDGSKYVLAATVEVASTAKACPPTISAYCDCSYITTPPNQQYVYYAWAD